MQTRSFTLAAAPTVEGDRRVRFVASTPAVDSHGTRLHPKGCRLDRFKLAGQLPFLWNHNKDGEPEDVLGRVVAVEVTQDAVIATVEFDTQDNPKAARLLRRVKRGELCACSVGFMVLAEEPAADGAVDITSWMLAELSLVPCGSNAEALALRSLRAGFTLSATPSRTSASRAAVPKHTRSQTPMNPADILSKLGLAEGAAPDAIADALLKYMAGSPDAAEAKQLVIGLLGMLAPAPSSSSASDGMAAAAAEAVGEELRKAQGRIAELEAEQNSPSVRADAAIKKGQWCAEQRTALIEHIRAADKAGRKPFLFPEGKFSGRSVVYTAGGNPVTRKPTLEPPSSRATGQSVLADVEKRFAQSNGSHS